MAARSHVMQEYHRATPCSICRTCRSVGACPPVTLSSGQWSVSAETWPRTWKTTGGSFAWQHTAHTSVCESSARGLQLWTPSNRANQGDVGHQNSLDSLQLATLLCGRPAWSRPVPYLHSRKHPATCSVTRSHTPASNPHSAG
jgi:hypothetical protein